MILNSSNRNMSTQIHNTWEYKAAALRGPIFVVHRFNIFVLRPSSFIRAFLKFVMYNQDIIVSLIRRIFYSGNKDA